MKEDQQVSLPDGRKIGYGDYGDPQGEPVFFFHGWPSSRFHGKMLHEGGLERRLRIIAPDRPGIGVELREDQLARFPYRPYAVSGWFREDGSVAH